MHAFSLQHWNNLNSLPINVVANFLVGFFFVFSVSRETAVLKFILAFYLQALEGIPIYILHVCASHLLLMPKYVQQGY